jgi:hypothetical protein
MRAMVLAAGHDIRFQEMTSARCVIVGRRKGQDDTTTVTFTMDDAKKMGVGGGQQYAKMPRQMLAARATSELCRLIFADVIGGLISDVEAEDADPGETLATVTPMTTARRKTPVKAEPKAAEPTPPTPTDDEPVLDDDVIEAEIVEERQAKAEAEPVLDAVDQAIANVTDVIDAEIIVDRPSGMAAARAALNEAKAGKPTGPITAKQLKALQAGFVACGITDRDQRLAIAASLAGRPDLATANDLTAAEAKDVLDGLGFAQATDNPAATLKEATS